MPLVLLRDRWDVRVVRGRQQLASLQESLHDIERKIEQLLDRLMEASGKSVIAAYERRVRELEAQKAMIGDRITAFGKRQTSFEETYQAALSFLRSPWKFWCFERIAGRRALLRLVFAERLIYARGEGYRAARIAIPFMRQSGVEDPAGRLNLGTLFREVCDTQKEEPSSGR